jgi:hypothetical protein
MRSLSLTCHASTPSPFVRSLSVSVGNSDRQLSLRYTLEGEIARLRIPSARAPARVDELWRHTCFEAFVKSQGSAEYLELNFAPSGEWAAYQFSDYRAGMSPATSISAPAISGARTPSHLELSASVNIPSVRSGHARLALCAVVEDDEGRVSYWALAHPHGRPDFHHEDGFVLDY